jgi:hypothetical protein
MGKQSKITKLIMLMVVVFCVLLFASGQKTSAMLKDKAQMQSWNIEKLERWIVSYKALTPVKEKWNNTFVNGGEVKDLRTLYHLIGLEKSGLISDPEKLQIESHDRVVSDAGIDLGMTQLCLYSQSRKMRVHANSFSDLLIGLSDLSNRSDLILGEVDILPAEQKPTADITKFCVLLRDPHKPSN